MAWLAGLILAGRSHAVSLLQFDASFRQSIAMSNGCVVAWSDCRHFEQMAPCHMGSAYWTMPGLVGESISFVGNGLEVTPLSFANSATTLVSRVFVVADCNDAKPLATLVEAPCPLRIGPFTPCDGPPSFSASNVFGRASLSVDNAMTVSFDTGHHIYDFEFSEPCRLREIHIGGHPASPAWNRSWNGSIFEVIFAIGEISEVEAGALHDFLSMKWRVDCIGPKGRDSYETVKSMGLRTGNVYGSFILLR